MNRSMSRAIMLGLALLLILPVALQAQGKIVWIDSYRIRLEYKEFQDAQEVFNKEVEQWQTEIDQGQAEIEEMEADLAKQALILSDAKREEREEEIKQKKIEWQRAANDIFGPDGRADRRNAELTKPLNETIQAAIEKIALEEGYAMVIDNAIVTWSKPDLDITDKVLEELEKTQ